jgi:hypothetical protein
MTTLDTFLWGFGGSIAVEIVNVNRHLSADRSHIPKRFRSGGFWFWRFLLAFVAGGLAVAYDIDTRLLAANIGASAPLILQALASGIGSAASQLPAEGEE